MTKNLMTLLFLLSALSACAPQPSAGGTPAEETFQPTLMSTATVPDDLSDNVGNEGGESPPSATATLDVSGQPAQTTPTARVSLIFLVPQIEPSDPDTPFFDPVIISYEERHLVEGETWVVEPDPFGVRFAQAVGALRLQLVEVREDGVVVDLLADERADGAFYPRAEGERHTLTDGTCLAGYPLVLDALYSYCFELTRSGSELRLSYHLESQSAMPPAP